MPRNSFERQIDSWVEQAIARGVADFAELVCRLPGVSPPEVASSLARIPTVPSHLRTLAPADGPIFAPFTGLVPHPLDFDWRFAREACERLTAELDRRVDGAAIVALFGCPTMLECVARPTRRVYLFDRNAPSSFPENSGPVEFVRGDIDAIPVPTLGADVAIVDPPWYPAEHASFLWCASSALRVGGTLIVSSAPVGARPAAAADQRGLVKVAQGLGLDLMAEEEAALAYHTPPFEGIAFHAVGVPPYSPTWRRGNMLVFKKTSECRPPRPLVPEKPSWSDHEYSGVRFKVVCAPFERFEPELETVVPGHVLTTVSRRDPARRAVQVWTSGNRVFSTGAPGLVSATLEATRLDVPAGELCEEVAGRPLLEFEREAMKRLEDQLQAIVNVERAEYISRGGVRGDGYVGGTASIRCEEGP